MPLLSVVTAFNNVEDYLEETIRSVLAQTFSDFEYLLIDDGSTDTSLEIARKFQLENRHLKIISGPRQGASSARNTGIDQAEGEWIAFLDGDDRWNPLFLESMVKEISQQEKNCVGGFAWSERITTEGNRTDRFSRAPLEKYFLPDMLAAICPPGNGSCLLVRKSKLEEAGKFDPLLASGQDAEMWLRILNLSKELYFKRVPKVLVDYRRGRPGSLTQTRITNRMVTLDQNIRKYSQGFSTQRLSKIYLRLASYAFGNREFSYAAIFFGRALLFRCPLVYWRKATL